MRSSGGAKAEYAGDTGWKTYGMTRRVMAKMPLVDVCKLVHEHRAKLEGE